MRKPIVCLVAAAVAVSGVLTGVAPASATMAGVASSAVGKAAERTGPTAENVQYRGNRRYYRGGRHYRSGRYYHYPRRHYYGRYYHHKRRDRGSAVAAGIIGLGIGALLGGALANQGYAGSDRHAYCASKYRSYDPRSGTYLGYDGYRHPCR